MHLNKEAGSEEVLLFYFKAREMLRTFILTEHVAVE
jgi:hypothetical protein